ncbi:MAG: hypothetical protein RLZZ584_2771 [Pseudomonadota bacterium]|jgi:NAD-dependent deacetylase
MTGPGGAELDHVAGLLRQARHVAVLTGAGVSAESGVSTFRDALTGLWSHVDPMDLATAEAYATDPELVWGWYEWRRMLLLRARPNPAHLALAQLARRVERLTLVTQNVDDLHERAGSTGVIHLHGSMFAPRCLDCAAPYALPPGLPDEPDGGRRLAPPRCAHCGGPVRPGVVWFNEMLPRQAWAAAEAAAASCDVLLSIGTSGLVYPAAGLPRLAAEHLAQVVIVNPEAEAQRGLGDIALPGPAGVLLPAVVARLG